MQDEIFAQRLKNWSSEGELAAFNLACVAEALDTVKKLSDQNIGWEVVEKRIGEYKNWDPDILKVDKETEGGYWRRLEEKGTPFTFLSEEAGTVEINKDSKGDKYNVVCDPFDGSYLFKHGIPAFWYSSLALYSADLQPVCCAVGDCFPHVIAFAHDKGAFIADLAGEELLHRVKLDKKYREALNMFNRVAPGYNGVKEAIFDVNKIIEKDAEIYYREGVKRFLNEELEEAINEWEKTLVLNPEHQKAKRDIENARGLLEKLKQIK